VANYDTVMDVSAQVMLTPDPVLEPGLRERKKIRTRLAIEDVALSLFEEQGYEATTVEEIAARAEVSTTTFFRYYPTKAEILLGDHGLQLPALLQAIVDRPSAENDLEAFRLAVQQEWVAAVDATRTARKARIVATSDLLSGLSFHRGHRWLYGIVDALSQRNSRSADDERNSLAARVGLEALASAVDRWIADDCAGALSEYVDTSFSRMAVVCGELSH
jgi:AcrR family transcriptional regulator